jgi:hypothetical protein
MNRNHLPRFSYRSFPFILLLICLAVFGLFLNQVGFYWDDWPAAFTARQFPSTEFWQYFADERPLSAWTYLLFAPLFGSSVLAWQIFALVLRFLTALSMWWAFSNLWPRQRRLVSAATLLFAVYPVFLQQNHAITYHQLWIQYIAFFCSLGAMVQSVRQPRRYLLWTIIGVVGLLTNLSISEYFYSVELIRPLVIWIALENKNLSTRQRLLRTLRVWLPYLLVLGLGIGNWLFFKNHQTGFTFNYGEKIGSPNKPVVLERILQNPFNGLRSLVQSAVQDSIYILAAIWAAAVDPTSVELNRPLSIFLMIFSAAVAALSGLYLYRLDPQDDHPAQEVPGSRWEIQAALLGVIIVILGALPAWVTGRQTINGIFDNRFAAVSMSGASLVILAGARWAIERWSKLVTVICLLLWLAMGIHLRTGNEYRHSWREQKQLYWQLYWRAPSIKPNTVILMDGLHINYMVRSSISFALNLLYAQGNQKHELAYWAYPMSGDDYLARLPFSAERDRFRWAYRQYPFSAQRPDSLMVYTNRDPGTCYWVLRPKDTNVPDLPVAVQAALPYTNLERIEAVALSVPPRETFGPEPPPNWCTYYQKAELAAQMGDWSRVTELGEEARAAGYDLEKDHLVSPYESRPFIEGYAYQGNWEEAYRLTLASYQKKPVFGRLLCHTWKDLEAGEKDGGEGKAFMSQALREMKCR